MTFAQDFIDTALLEHNKWIDKIKYICTEFDVPIAWRSNLITQDTELHNLLAHMRFEIQNDTSIYSELRFELEFSKELINKMHLHAHVICLLIDVIKRKALSTDVIAAIKETIAVVVQEIYTASTDIISRLARWKDIQQ